MKNVDTLIIGCGLSGIAAGIRISQFQKKVVIVESHSIPGGLNSYYYRNKQSILFSSGLHTVTNYNSKNRKWGLGLICRNLGIKKEQLNLFPAKFPSVITMPNISLKFSNDIETLTEEINTKFPGQIDGFNQFVELILSDNTGTKWYGKNASSILSEYFSSQSLVDLLSIPIYYYSGYQEKDIDFSVYARLFRSLYIDGCCSPVNIKTLLDVLTSKFINQGGEIIFNKKVSSLTLDDGKIKDAVLSDGSSIEANNYLSTIGYHETGNLVDRDYGEISDISLFESVLTYESEVSQYGVTNTLHFVYDQDCFLYDIPNIYETPTMFSISFLDNYDFEELLPSHQAKICTFQKGSDWRILDKNQYKKTKNEYEGLLKDKLNFLYPGLDKNEVTHVDSFSPRTIERFTSHPNGTLYGGTQKVFDGRTDFTNLFIAGNDQGGIGIMGALTSGITVSNYNIIL